jgi:hypothetical protein
LSEKKREKKKRKKKEKFDIDGKTAIIFVLI